MVTRRTVTFGGLSLPLLGGVSFARSHGAWAGARPLIVILSGIEPGITFERLSALCDPFLDHDICVTLGLSLSDGGSGGFSYLVDDLRHAADRYSELIELAIDAGEILSVEPYWQLRQASTLQAQFTKAVNPVEDISVQPLLMAMTLLTSSPAREVADLGNMRAAGIRTVIHLSRSLPTNGTAIRAIGWPAPDCGMPLYRRRCQRPGLCRCRPSKQRSTVSLRSRDRSSTTSRWPRPQR